MTVEERIVAAVKEAIGEMAGQTIDTDQIVLQKTRKEFEGDLTLVVFPFAKRLGRPPGPLAEAIGQAVAGRVREVVFYNVAGGFLNLSLQPAYWLSFLETNAGNESYGYRPAPEKEQKPVVVEFSSPNTNKPLHLGHIRNNLLGFSVTRILEAAGHSVVKVNLVNDRGIHICKSMLAWMKYGKGETPGSTGKKGDKLVGDYYVKFESLLHEQVRRLIDSEGFSEEEARNRAPLMVEARELLRRWEAGDPEVTGIWKMMNAWVYEGFDATYRKMGITFDKIYYESDTYLLGRDIVRQGLSEGRLEKKDDGSVWADLSLWKLDEKLLLRADGTSVYMTQDIGTAQLRYDDFHPERMIYVVGNEQNYHFDVLKKVLTVLGKPYAGMICHLSYGMVELPEGKMKSREGKVVDADDLMDEMVETARRTTEELGKIQDLGQDETDSLNHMIGLGALKYFILKVDPKKNMLFNPSESIDFNGHTGPFIQYTHARIRSIMRSAGTERLAAPFPRLGERILNEKELSLLKNLHSFEGAVVEAAREFSPALIANYVYELCREYNQFYHEYSVLNEPDRSLSDFRLQLSRLTGLTIGNGMKLLGIGVPEKM